MRGGLGIALLAGGAFVIGTPPIWTVSRVDALDQCLEVCVFCLVGGVSGLLTDRHRKQERALRRTGNQLRQAHQELEKNFEKMKRAERIYALAQLSAGLAHEIRTPRQAWKARQPWCNGKPDPKSGVGNFLRLFKRKAGGSIAQAFAQSPPHPLSRVCQAPATRAEDG